MSAGAVLAADLLAVGCHGHAADRDERPGHHGGIAVLAENKAVNVLRVQADMLGNARAQAAGIEQRARANDLALRQTCNLEDGIGENIDRIGNDDINRV